MPWSKNDGVYTQIMDIEQALNNAEHIACSELYRSRRPIDTSLLKYVALPFQLFNTTADNHNAMVRLFTHAMPREEQVEDSVEKVMGLIDHHNESHKTSRVITMINISNYNVPAAQLVEKLIEEHWEEKDFRAALTCTPFHSVRLFTKHAEVWNFTSTCIITNDISDDLILKLSAVLPAIHGFTIPQDVAAAYLECDKLKFLQALEVNIQGIIEARKRAKLETGLTNLQRILRSRDRQDRMQQDIQSLEDTIEKLTEQMADCFKRKQEAQLKLASTMWGNVDTAADQFINYLKDTALPYITALRTPNNTCLDVQVVTELLYWDDEIFKRYMETTRDNVYTTAPHPMQSFFKDLLIDRTIKIIWHTGIRIRFDNNYVERNTNYLSAGSSTIGMPHPHTHWFNCWGNNRAPITKALGAQDYIVAWEQIRSAMSGLNMSDTAVLNEFTRQIQGGCRRIPCIIVKETGERLSYEQYRTKYPDGVPTNTPEPEVVTPEPRKHRAAKITTEVE